MLTSPPIAGVLAWWPEPGHGWIFPDDIELVRRLVPSPRIVIRDYFDGTFYHFHYGRWQFRLRPCLWMPVPMEPFAIGESVEVRAVGAAREPFVARIQHIIWDSRTQQAQYVLRRREMRCARRYARNDLRKLERALERDEQWLPLDGVA